MSVENLIKIKNIYKSYGKGSVKNEVLKDIDLNINEGEFVSIMGKSGSGKSTLLNIIATIEKPDKGQIVIDGNNIEKLSLKKANDFRREYLGFIFQDFKLIESMNVKENIAVPLLLKNEKPNTINQKIDNILKKLNIEYLKDKNSYEISGGEKQRVACARALIGNPKIILADEPTGALDSNSAENLMNLIKDINKKFNTTVLLVTHDKNVAEYGDRIITIKDGEIEG